MRKALNIEHILSDMNDLAVSVANGNERIVSAWFDKDDDLIIRTELNGETFEWEIGIDTAEEE